MRIAVVVRSLQIGGMERAAINLAEAFQENGHEAHLIYFKDKNKALEPNENVKVHHFNINKLINITVIGFFWNVLSKLISIIIRESYVFLIAFLATPIFKYKIKLLEKKYGKFDLIILRGQGTFETIWNIKDKRVVQQQVSITIRYSNPLKRFYLRCLYNNKNIMCNSSGVEEVLLKALKISNASGYDIKVIPSPLNVHKVQKMALEYIPKIDFKYVVNVGRFAPGKNILFLLEAYAYAIKELSLTHKLVLVGDGVERQNIEKKIDELDLSDSVILTGYVKNPYPWIKNASLFILSSKKEGFPNVLLEALACETNIVSTKTRGGVKDIMKGELINNLVDFDKKLLAKKIAYEVNKNSKINFKNYTEEFIPSFIVEQYIKTYISVNDTREI